MTPIATIVIEKRDARVASHVAPLVPGTYRVFSEAQVNELLRRIAELEAKK